MPLRKFIPLAVLTAAVLFACGYGFFKHVPVTIGPEPKETVPPSPGETQVKPVASGQEGQEQKDGERVKEVSVPYSRKDFSVAQEAPQKAGKTGNGTNVNGRDGESKSSLASGEKSNHPPVIKSLVAEQTELYEGTSCNVKCSALDSDDDELSYKWSADGGGISGQGSAVTWTAPLRGGEFTLTVTVSDGKGGVDTEQVVIKVITCSRCEL